MRPLLFLDVDGVLNVPFCDPPRIEVRSNLGVTYCDAQIGKRIQELLQHYEPVWATAWRKNVHPHHRDALGLPESPWPHLDYDKWKLVEIVRWAKDRRWAWVDDDAKWELHGLAPEFAVLPNSLIICPDDRIGMTDEHVQQLIHFASETNA